MANNTKYILHLLISELHVKARAHFFTSKLNVVYVLHLQTPTRPKNPHTQRPKQMILKAADEHVNRYVSYDHIAYSHVCGSELGMQQQKEMCVDLLACAISGGDNSSH